MRKIIKESLHQFHVQIAWPWLVGIIGSKDSSMVASFIFNVIIAAPSPQRIKATSMLCTKFELETLAWKPKHAELLLLNQT